MRIMERLKKRQQQDAGQSMPTEANEDKEWPPKDNASQDVSTGSQLGSAAETEEQKEGSPKGSKEELRSDVIESVEDTSVCPESQVCDVNKTGNEQSPELSSSKSSSRKSSHSPQSPENSQTEEAPRLEGNINAVEEQETSAVTTPTGHQPTVSALKRKAPPPPAQQQQHPQRTQKQAKEQTRRTQQQQQQPRIPRTARHRVQVQSSVEDSKVKRRAPAPPSKQLSESELDSKKKQKRKAPIAPVTSRQTEPSLDIVVEGKPKEDSEKKEEPQPVGVSVEPAGIEPVKKAKRKAPQPQRPQVKSEKSERDAEKSDQQGSQMDESKDKKPKPRRRKEKAPPPPQTTATQPNPSEEEIAWVEKQLEEKKAEDQKKQMLLSVPVDTIFHALSKSLSCSDHHRPVSFRLAMKLAGGRCVSSFLRFLNDSCFHLFSCVGASHAGCQ